MKIIISPAKKMKVDTDTFEIKGWPAFIEDSEMICNTIQKMSYDELKTLWNCNYSLTQINYERFQNMDLRKQLTPAILAYEGLQYQHIAPAVLTDEALQYIQANLRILSGFYGVLSPFDGVVPYRLEMQAKLPIGEHKNLYEFWKNRLYQQINEPNEVIINLASKEYSQVIEKHLKPEDQMITCIFGERSDGKVKQKGTLAKMARGEMVRFMAENKVSDIEIIKNFSSLGMQFDEEMSSNKEFIFLKEN